MANMELSNSNPVSGGYKSARSRKSRTEHEGLISVASERKCQKSIVIREKVQLTGCAIDVSVATVNSTTAKALEDQSARSMKSRTRGVDLRSFRAQMPKEHSHQRESTVDRSIIYSFLLTWFETYDQDEQLKGSKLDYLASLSKVREAEEIIRKLKCESERTERRKSKLVVENEVLRHKPESAAKMEDERKCISELFTLTELHEVHGNQPSVQIKELEAQMTSLEQELELLRTTNRDMEVQIENKAIEAKHLAEQNVGLQSQISEPEMVSQKREKELLTLTKKLEDNENLTVQTNKLLLDMKRLRTQKAKMEEHIVFRSDEASTSIKSLMDQLNTLQQELESLHSQKAELELQLERKTRTISDYVTDIEKDLRRDLEAKGDGKITSSTRLQIKLGEKYKQLETSLQDCKATIEVTERKMQEMAGEHN
ncbi:hypothetical protein GOBAR_AA12328 [Gossypium barbadense]|uniref:Uncharacterized protein n=1 Tax=Gossypium barbadense TaxID=3634 RepID=A0A2P5XY94_GOSBA|nr:hypothetical protein GOBAR_AA12328 [Gossypium barbadense]